MATDSFRRHARACADASIHRGFAAFAAVPEQRAFYARLVAVVRARSGCGRTLAILENLVPFEAAVVRPPETWPGATGHPLRVIDSLAAHLFAQYPAPRFLASVWFGDAAPARVERRRWVVAYVQGQALRRVAPALLLNRRMEHVLLQTADHVPFDHAVRRAEILALGGSEALATAVRATRLAEHVDAPARWREVLGWLARREADATIDLGQVGPLVDFLEANPDVSLKGRTFASAIRLVEAWHGGIEHETTKLVTWPRSRWAELVEVAPPEAPHLPAAEWRLVELLDSSALWQEGRRMRHCVGTYTRECASGGSSIWSLRYCCNDQSESVLTIQVRRAVGEIVQVRGKRNARGEPAALARVQRWAARERLGWWTGWR